MSYYIVYDDFLPPHDFGVLKAYLGPNGGFPHSFSGRINNDDKTNSDMYFGTPVYYCAHGPGKEWKQGVDLEVFAGLTSKLVVWNYHRIKANLYLPSGNKEVRYHAPHVDAEFPHNGALLYLTTCNAPTTLFDGTTIESIENRLLLFDPTKPHFSASPSDALYRITININYFGEGVCPNYQNHMINPIPTLEYNSHKLLDVKKRLEI
jgi:hypothetical protein